MQGQAYIVNMPVELFVDGYISFRNSQRETDKLKKDRYLRSTLILLFAALEAELNRQLHITSYPDKEDIKDKLNKVLTKKGKPLSTISSLESELDKKDVDSFRSVRNGIAHFKGNYTLYGLTEKNIDRYYKFTKTAFELIHSTAAVAEWINKV